MKDENVQLRNDNEAGFGAIESLVSIVLMSIIAVAIIMNLVVALRTAKITEVNHAASTLAVSKMEELASIDTLNLDDSYDAVENNVAWGDFNFTFTRTTSITVNADNTRSVDVTVSSNSTNVPSTVSFSTTFALWE